MVHIIPFVAVSLGGMMQWVQSPRFLEQDTHCLVLVGFRTQFERVLKPNQSKLV